MVSHSIRNHDNFSADGTGASDLSDNEQRAQIMNRFLQIIATTIVVTGSAVAESSAQTNRNHQWETPPAVIRTDVYAAVNGSTYKTYGAIAGFVAGAGITALVVHSGGSTSLCDRNANQDAMNSTECAGLIAAGGLVGGIAGYFIGSRIHRDVRLEVMPRVSPRGSYFTVGMRKEISSPRMPARSER